MSCLCLASWSPSFSNPQTLVPVYGLCPSFLQMATLLSLHCSYDSCSAIFARVADQFWGHCDGSIHHVFGPPVLVPSVVFTWTVSLICRLHVPAVSLFGQFSGFISVMAAVQARVSSANSGFSSLSLAETPVSQSTGI